MFQTPNVDELDAVARNADGSLKRLNGEQLKQIRARGFAPPRPVPSRPDLSLLLLSHLCSLGASARRVAERSATCESRAVALGCGVIGPTCGAVFNSITSLHCAHFSFLFCPVLCDLCTALLRCTMTKAPDDPSARAVCTGVNVCAYRVLLLLLYTLYSMGSYNTQLYSTGYRITQFSVHNRNN